jgi:hypothetical protein
VARGSLHALTPEDPLQSLRLGFKRAFTAYYREVGSPGIADPTQAFATCHAYLSALLDRLGPHEFMARLDDETTHLVGEVEQDLRHRAQGRRGRPAPAEPERYDDLEDRLRECFNYARGCLQQLGLLKKE